MASVSSSPDAIRASLCCEKMSQTGVESIGGLKVDDMPSGQRQVATTQDGSRNEIEIAGRTDGILFAGYGKHRMRDTTEVGTEICIAQGRTAADISLDRCLFESRDELSNDVWGTDPEPWREPSLLRSGDKRRQPVLRDGLDPLLPWSRVADPGGRGAEDEFVEAVSGMDGKPLSDQATDGETAEMRAFDGKAVHEGEDVFGKLSERVGRRWRGRKPMTATVVAQDPECLSQSVYLAIPHVKIGAQRIAKDEPGFAGITSVEAIVQSVLRAVEIRHVVDP